MVGGWLVIVVVVVVFVVVWLSLFPRSLTRSILL